MGDLPIRIEVPTTTVLTIKQAQMIPYERIVPLRATFDNQTPSEDLAHWSYKASKNPHTMSQLTNWAKVNQDKGQVFEIHFPFRNFKDFKQNKTGMLSNPNHEAALYFIAGKNFNSITGHPVGTELYMVDNLIYRRLTWRSITTTYWDKRSSDYGVAWADDYLVHFVWSCEKINEEPLRSAVIDGIGVELLERDRPKIQDEGWAERALFGR